MASDGGAPAAARMAAVAKCVAGGIGGPAVMKLKDGWEAELDRAFSGMVDNPTCAVPGLVVLARRGQHRYHKAFGFADLESRTPMELDAQFRCFSMTKVLASAAVLALIDQGADLGKDRPVGDYIPSFSREWTVVSEPPPGRAPQRTVAYESFLTGETATLGYDEAPATQTMLVGHLMGECSGIGYDQWTDIDLWLGAPLGKQYGVAQALRRAAGKGFYSSNCIVGQDATLSEYCDAIAGAGVLVCEPGTFSYGLGALVLGRVVEVAHTRLRGRRARFADICAELFFRPLGMDSAAFYLADGDARAARVPTLYGGVLREPGDRVGAGGCDVRRYEDCLPRTSVPNTVATDTFAGPRKCDSGDTGATMTVADYATFYECLLAGGLAPSGERVLSERAVRTLTHGAHAGLNRANPLAALMQLDDEARQSFNYGWARVPRRDGAPHCNFWSGYANNHGRLYVEDDAYVLVFPQFMGSSPGGWLLGGKTVRDKATDAFLSVWA